MKDIFIIMKYQVISGIKLQWNIIPIKKEIIKEANIIMKTLFKGTYNIFKVTYNILGILGVKIRGTNYIKNKPLCTSYSPKVEDAIYY